MVTAPLSAQHVSAWARIPLAFLAAGAGLFVPVVAGGSRLLLCCCRAALGCARQLVMRALARGDACVPGASSVDFTLESVSVSMHVVYVVFLHVLFCVCCVA